METQQFQEVKKQRGKGEPELHCILPVISNTNLTRRACLLATLVFILFHMCSLWETGTLPSVCGTRQSPKYTR